MKKTRAILLGLFVAANSMVGVSAVYAAEDLNVDRLGGVIVVWCDHCYFWNCNC
ncbi:MAG TPA: hypothetical protein VGB92_25155 [Longimicrobium sp.]|jgi:hypothetical protein